MIDPEFWNGRRVLITGHMGFKGSWLSLWLNSLGARVTGFCDCAPTVPALFDVAEVERDVDNIVGDVRDLVALSNAVRAAQPSVVFHLAAQSLVRESFANPVATYSTNVMGTVNVLEAVRATPEVRAVLVATSDKCYENREWEWPYREQDELGGIDPYSSSKAAAELVTSAYRRSYFGGQALQPHGAVIDTARAGNVIGGGDWTKDQLVPDVMRAIAAGAPVRLRNPGAVRPWQHVLDALHGYLLIVQRAIEQPGVGEAWNVGPGADDARSVGSLVERICSLWGSTPGWIADQRESVHEARALRLDSSKLRIRFGWAPRLELEEALEWTVDWYRANAMGAVSMRGVTLDQIRQYQQLAARGPV